MNGRTVWTGLFLLAAWADAQTAAEPRIFFTAIPPQGSTVNLTGGTLAVDPADYAVAVYLYVGGWWNKPTNASPLTVFAPDGTWECDVTTGGADAFATRFAAFVVPRDFSPPILDGAPHFPAALEEIALARVVAPRKSPHAFHFSGYDWDVKTVGERLAGPGPNRFSDSPENVWVDAEGRLHLRITFRDGQWRCAEVISDASFGYGTYRFYLDSPVDALDPNVVLGLFTWSDDPAYAYREIDVEIARWGNAADSTNAQFVVQPWHHPGNLTRYTIPAGAQPTTHSFDWKADQIDFASHDGAYSPLPPAPPVLSSWSYTGPDIPVPGDEQVRLNLWLVNGLPPTDGQEAEVVISRFVFIPATLAAPRLTSFSFARPEELRLELQGTPQLLYQLQRSTNLLQWQTLETQTAAEAAFHFTTPADPDSSPQFFRIHTPPQ